MELKSEVLKGLISTRQGLEDENKVAIADNFDCKVVSFVPGHKTYLQTKTDKEGNTITKLVLPDSFSKVDGSLVIPKDVTVVDTTNVVLRPIIEGKPLDSVVSGFVFDTSIRGLPDNVSAVGLKAQATGVIRQGVYKDKGKDKFFITGVDISNDNDIIKMMRTAEVSGFAMYSQQK